MCFESLLEFRDMHWRGWDVHVQLRRRLHGSKMRCRHLHITSMPECSLVRTLRRGDTTQSSWTGSLGTTNTTCCCPNGDVSVQLSGRFQRRAL